MSKSKAINVKIPTVKIIAALEQALNKLEVDYTSQEKLEEEYKKAYETATNATQTGKIFNFASEQDRLLAKIGLFAATQARR